MALSNAEKQARWREKHAANRDVVRRVTAILLRQNLERGGRDQARPHPPLGAQFARSQMAAESAQANDTERDGSHPQEGFARGTGAMAARPSRQDRQGLSTVVV